MSTHVSTEEVVAGVILTCEVWGPITVLGKDGVLYEIKIVEGHSGPEHEVRKAPSQDIRKLLGLPANMPPSEIKEHLGVE